MAYNKKIRADGKPKVNWGGGGRSLFVSWSKMSLFAFPWLYSILSYLLFLFIVFLLLYPLFSLCASSFSCHFNIFSCPLGHSSSCPHSSGHSVPFDLSDRSCRFVPAVSAPFVPSAWLCAGSSRFDCAGLLSRFGLLGTSVVSCCCCCFCFCNWHLPTNHLPNHFSIGAIKQS